MFARKHRHAVIKKLKRNLISTRRISIGLVIVLLSNILVLNALLYKSEHSHDIKAITPTPAPMMAVQFERYESEFDKVNGIIWDAMVILSQHQIKMEAHLEPDGTGYLKTSIER